MMVDHWFHKEPLKAIAERCFFFIVKTGARVQEVGQVHDFALSYLIPGE